MTTSSKPRIGTSTRTRSRPSVARSKRVWIPLLDDARAKQALLPARGVRRQQMYVDPELKLVLVHTAVAKTASINNDSMGAELSALWYGLVNTFGRW